MVELLTSIVSKLVDTPESISITEYDRDGVTVVHLSVAEDDMGKVIGKHGRIAKALRLVVKAAGGKQSKRVFLEIS